GAGHFHPRLQAAAHPDVFHNVARTAMLLQQICAALGVEYPHLLHIVHKINGSRSKRFIKIDGLPLKIGNEKLHRDAPRRVKNSSRTPANSAAALNIETKSPNPASQSHRCHWVNPGLQSRETSSNPEWA